MRIVLAVALLLLAGCVALGWQSAVPPLAPTAAKAFPAYQVALGATLAAAGNCAGCHTVAGGALYSGGLGLETGYGLAYSSNISPDPQTGIGQWSEAAFARAMREGVSRNGSQLFPAFPYTHFTRLSDEDVSALYAFFMTRDAVVATPPANTIRFPYNVRALQSAWKLLYFDRGVYQTDTTHSKEWNRGAYLAEGITHCGACHTPRNTFGAEQDSQAYTGAPIDGWWAPSLTADNPAPLPWTRIDVFDYLRTGESERHGVAAGLMGAVVHQGLKALPDADVMALAIYFSDLNGSSMQARASSGAAHTDTNANTSAAPQHMAMSDVAGAQHAPGASLFLAACASCHYRAQTSGATAPAGLALSTSLTADNPSNFIQTVLLGVGGAGTPGPFMPGFAAALSDSDIALLANYMRQSRTTKTPWPNMVASVAERRPTAAVRP